MDHINQKSVPAKLHAANASVQKQHAEGAQGMQDNRPQSVTPFRLRANAPLASRPEIFSGVVQRVVKDADGDKLGRMSSIRSKLVELGWNYEAGLLANITKEASEALTKSGVEFTLNPQGRKAFTGWLEANQEPGIEYNSRGKYADRNGLINHTAAYFQKQTKRDLALIESEVILQEKSRAGKKKVDAFASELQWIMITKHDWPLPGVSPAVEENAKAGPQIPVFAQKRTKDAEKLKESSHNTFSFGQKTVAQADLMDMKTGKRLKSFVANSDGLPHAEAVLKKNIEDYLSENEIDPASVRVRITLNNSPCHNAGHECGKMLGRLQEEIGLGGLHVYFARVYGTAEEAGISFDHMKKGGVKLTPFNAANYMHPSYKKQAVDKLGRFDDPESIMPSHKGVAIKSDPFSENEDSDNEASEKKEHVNKRSRKSYEDEHKEIQEQKEESKQEEVEIKHRRKRIRRMRKDASPPRGSGLGLDIGNFAPDSVFMDGRTYRPTAIGIRDSGTCLWDTLRANGFTEQQLQQAARQADVEYNKYFYIDRMNTFANSLSAVVGRPVQMQVSEFDILTMQPRGVGVYGAGGMGATIVHIGFGHDNANGHFVPPADK
jgi:hypothetical protein